MPIPIPLRGSAPKNLPICSSSELITRTYRYRYRSDTLVAISLAPYRSHSGPSGPKSQKSRKKSSEGLSAPGSEKVGKSRKKVENDTKTTFLSRFQPCFDFFFNLFWPRGREALGTFFSTFVRLRARRARMTPVRVQGDCNTLGN